MKLTLIKGGRAKLEMDLVRKIAEPRSIPEEEFQSLIAPLKPCGNLKLVETDHPELEMNLNDDQTNS